MSVAEFIISGGMASVGGDLPEHEQVTCCGFAQKFIKAVEQFFNEVQIPADSGTIFSASYLYVGRGDTNCYYIFASKPGGTYVFYQDLADVTLVSFEWLMKKFTVDGNLPLWAFSLPNDDAKIAVNFRLLELAKHYANALAHAKSPLSTEQLCEIALNIDKYIDVKVADDSAEDPFAAWEQKSKEEQIPTKRRVEADYWITQHYRSGNRALGNSHYEYFYTDHFDYPKDFYTGKKILDIGCGPRGSLEWADNALEAVGLDPLVPVYKELGIDQHRMQYVEACSEDIPFAEGYFDVVCSINSLDHVDDLEKTIAEIKRVLCVDGCFLLVTDVNHPPTPTEPICFSWDIVEKFKPELELLSVQHFEKIGGQCTSIQGKENFYDHTNKTERIGVLSANFAKKA